MELGSFNFKDFRKRNIIVYCETEQEAKNFIKYCIKKGMQLWLNSTEFLDPKNPKWQEYFCYSYCYGELVRTNPRLEDPSTVRILKWEIRRKKMKIIDSPYVSQLVADNDFSLSEVFNDPARMKSFEYLVKEKLE
jgi:hypothetical protein